MTRWTRIGCRAGGLFASIVVVASLFPGAACSVLIDADRQQCKTNEDCEKRGAAFSGFRCVDQVCVAESAWSCLGNVESPTTEPRKALVTMTFLHLITRKPIENVATQLCIKFDAACDNPFPEVPLKSNKDGIVTFEVDAPFDGYAIFTPPLQIPGSYFFSPKITEDRIVPPIVLIEETPFRTLAKNANEGIDIVRTDYGHVLLAVYNCDNEVTGGVSIAGSTMNESSRAFYIINGLPSLKDTTTDDQGWGGIINLPPGNAVVTGTLPSRDNAETGKVNLVIKPGQISYTSLHPTAPE